MKYTVSEICAIGELICVGCCGQRYKGRTKVTEDIHKNTLEYKHIRDKKKFMTRIKDPYDLRSSGVCRNLIFTDDTKSKVICPLHPVFNKPKEKKDIREGHCEIDHLCKAAKMFAKWEDEMKESFIDFIMNKNLDWYSFSIGMDSDSFIKEFLK